MSAFCLDCQNNVHFQCARPCNCRCTIEHLVQHTTHDNIIANTANIRHAGRTYSEVEVRQANRDLRSALVERRQYADETFGVTSRWYRFRKAIGKVFVTTSVTNSARNIKDYF